MQDSCSGKDVNLKPTEAAHLLAGVLNHRQVSQDLQRPDDVNGLLELFPRVTLREGYVLDYVFFEDSNASWIRPYARRKEQVPVDTLDRFIPLFDRQFVMGSELNRDQEQSEIETLYQYLDWQSSPEGAFEYSLFTVELWASKAGWHAGEWLDSTPVFTEARYRSFLEEADEVEEIARPAHFGPIAWCATSRGGSRFMVHSPVGWSRIYMLECIIHENKRVTTEVGETVCNLGSGFIY